MVVFKFASRVWKLPDRSNMTTFRRTYGTCRKLIFEQHGDPLKVLNLTEEKLPSLQADEVIVKFLVAPINPADINFIQGTYPLKIQLPVIAGLEGVGEVLKVGSQVKNFKQGDKIVPNTEGFGTWRTIGVFKPIQLLKIPNDLSTIEAAGITSNPCTAYRMLKDFVALKVGDVVIQNGGNSACGQNVIQLCKINKYISINIVRDRPDIENLKSYLKSIGADHVLTEEEIRTTQLFKNGLTKPKLALNCVGGRSATEIFRHLQNQGVMVTYGGMSREPVAIPTSAFIFKDITFRGYWMTRWTRENKESAERQQMLQDLANYMRNSSLKAPEYKLVPLADYKEAIMKSSSVQGFTGCKYMLDLNY